MNSPSPSPAARPILARSVLVPAALCWAGFTIVAWLATSGRVVAIDHAGLAIWRGPAPVSPVLLEMVRDLTALGGATVRNMLALVAVTALLFMRRRWDAVWLMATVASGTALAAGLKALFERARPDVVPHLMEAAGTSFPSGHSFNGAAVYLAIALAFAATRPAGAARYALIGGALLLGAAIAWSRVWLGVHYPTDVIAGWLAGVGWVLLASLLMSGPVSPPRRHPPAA